MLLAGQLRKCEWTMCDMIVLYQYCFVSPPRYFAGNVLVLRSWWARWRPRLSSQEPQVEWIVIRGHPCLRSFEHRWAKAYLSLTTGLHSSWAWAWATSGSLSSTDSLKELDLILTCKLLRTASCKQLSKKPHKTEDWFRMKLSFQRYEKLQSEKSYILWDHKIITFNLEEHQEINWSGHPPSDMWNQRSFKRVNRILFWRSLRHETHYPSFQRSVRFFPFTHVFLCLSQSYPSFFLLTETVFHNDLSYSSLNQYEV